MIWYDVMTKAPVAPGAGEDSGTPSINGYDCPNCHEHVQLIYEEVNGHGYGICPECDFTCLTTG